MAQGNVTTNNLNLAQGGFNAVERKALFIGQDAVAGTHKDQYFTLNAQSDINDLLGETDTPLISNLKAAQANGGENWFAHVYVSDPASPKTVADINELLTPVDVEIVFFADDIATANIATAAATAHTQAELARTSQAKRVSVRLAVEGIDDSNDTWAEYEAALVAAQDGISAYRVGLVPQLHGNNLGVLAGRLCNHSVSIADSPMRVKTGAVIGLGAIPVDTDDSELSNATMKALADSRFSCPQVYTGFDGTYWGDDSLLDAEAGDYQVSENLRVMDKVCRLIRVKQIQKVADRAFNSTPASVAFHESYFSGPLRSMSKSVTVNGIPFPAEIQAPKKDAIVFNWVDNKTVEIYVTLKPYNSPKNITANVMLDLSL